MISRRPIHISTIMIPFETSLKGANEPIGPAKPNAGPTFPSVVAEAATAFVPFTPTLDYSEPAPDNALEMFQPTPDILPGLPSPSPAPCS